MIQRSRVRLAAAHVFQSASRWRPPRHPGLVVGRCETKTRIDAYKEEAFSNHARREFSGWTGARGHDITGESLEWGDRPKVIVHSFAPTGFDVQNTVKRIDETEGSDGVVHMNGSILVFPFGCFLWKVGSPADVTLESLAPVLLHRPKLDYLFIGCNNNSKETISDLNRIQAAFRSHGIVVEQMALSNAVGTFNILNAEDRQVAAALVLDSGDDARDSNEL